MNSKKVAFFTFILVAFIQVYVPAKMILDREDVLTNGQKFKFKTAPIDPNDPFIGKYIILRYAENSVKNSEKENWLPGELTYVSVINDPAGFAKIKAISRKQPTGTNAYFKANVIYVTEEEPSRVIIDFPFDRYYMEESKAPAAEKLYQQLQNDTTQTTYAVVSIKNGTAVLEDVRIDNVSIRELVQANQKKNKDQ